MFEPNQNPPHVIPESGLLPETTNEFQPNPYANVYAVNQPYFTPHITHQYLTPHITQPYIPQQILLTEQTAGNKTHKWWSFHNLKEKFKSFFHKHKNKHIDETQNSANLFNNQPQLQQGKIICNWIHLCELSWA